MPLARHVVPVVLASLVASTSTAAAQDASGPRPPAGRFVVGAGVDPLSTERGPSTPGFAFTAGYERRLGDSPASLRVEWNHWSRGVRYDGIVDGQPVPSIARIRTIYGANLLGLWQFAPTSRVRPYALAGLGVQQISLRNETDWVPGERENTGSKIVTQRPIRVNSVAYTAGFGLDVPVGRFSLFGEGRATVLPAGMLRDGRGRVQGIVTPLTLGVRF
jgi:opacity protein-like surface antigen